MRRIELVSFWWSLLCLGAERIPVGGQAVIEGVLMRGPCRWGLAVRRSGGDIWSTWWKLAPWAARGIWKFPVLRGLAVMGEMLSTGMRALSRSAEIALGEEEKLTPWDMALSGIVALGGVVGLFLLLPMWGADLLMPWIGDSDLGRHVVEGVLRALVFVGYLTIIGLWGDIRRVFAYHGAEHKTINAYEHDAPLMPESVATFSRIHPRCGTSLLLVVVVMSIIVFALAGNGPLWWRMISRVVLLPVVVGLAYEFMRWSWRSKVAETIFMKPALSLQYLTTREPDRDQVAVGIASLQVALEGASAPEPPVEPGEEERYGDCPEA